MAQLPSLKFLLRFPELWLVMTGFLFDIICMIQAAYGKSEFVRHFEELTKCSMTTSVCTPFTGEKKVA